MSWYVFVAARAERKKLKQAAANIQLQAAIARLESEALER